MSFVSPLVLYNALITSTPSPLTAQDVNYLDHLGKVRKIVTTNKYNWLLERMNFHRRGFESRNPYESSERTMNHYPRHQHVDATQTHLDSTKHLRACDELSDQLKKIDYVVSENMWYKVRI